MENCCGRTRAFARKTLRPLSRPSVPPCIESQLSIPGVRLMKALLRAATAVIALMTVATLSGCSTVGVKPWQRDILARPEMALDANPVDTAFDEHVYFSKE